MEDKINITDKENRRYTIDIICPVYNAAKCILELDKSIKRQKNVNINKINYVVTESNDGTEKILKRNSIEFENIKKSEFSHSLTREKMASKSIADVIVYITQDIIIERDDWLYNLTFPIINGECELSYSRQICRDMSIEKYTREKNYPKESFLVTKNDIEQKGLRTFFLSDASSAIKNEVFKKLNYYDGKMLTTSEDMYIAYKAIMNGYRIKYCADSEIIHSHNFSIKQIYNRYYEIGVFFKENDYLDKYKTGKNGIGLAKYILRRSIAEKNSKAIIRFLPDMVARFLGMMIGKSKRNNYINILLGIIIL